MAKVVEFRLIRSQLNYLVNIQLAITNKKKIFQNTKKLKYNLKF